MHCDGRRHTQRVPLTKAAFAGVALIFLCAAHATPQLLPPPDLSSPPNGAINQPITTTVDWNSVFGATAYNFQVSTNSLFTTTTYNDTIIGLSFQIGPLLNGRVYYWRVRAMN